MSSSDTTAFDHLIREFLASKVFALVGASRNPEKYGNIILKNMASKGFTVVPVNPSEKEIEGLSCSPDIKSLPDYVKFANIVLPPQRSLSILPECAAKGIEIAWFQPGAYDDAVVAECARLGLRCIHGPCIMVCATTGC